MKIEKILLENHYILGNMELDFTDKNGKIINTIVIAGENGTGKSTVLNLISELFRFTLHTREDEKIIYEIILSKEEIENLKSDNAMKRYIEDFEDIKKIRVVHNTKEFPKNDHRSIWFELINEKSEIKKISSIGYLQKAKLKSIFSDVEINFQSGNITTVTSKELDQEVTGNIKSNTNLSREITQLLVDIQAEDDADGMAWTKENRGQALPEEYIDTRIKRFKRAFERMFYTKKYKGVFTRENSKKVTFSENGNEVYIDDLSSGEKQIVYRGSFCLKDKAKLRGSVAMVDEPEISLHPEWQKRIVPFYQGIFSDSSGKQTSQIFLVTHSPFIIHNENRINDKIIILKKEESGKIAISDENKFYGWTSEEIVKEAFNMDDFIKDDGRDHLIITEGKTDKKHIKNAIKNLRGEEVLSKYNFYENEKSMGDKKLLTFCKNSLELFEGKKIICIFDRDNDDVLRAIKDRVNDYKKWNELVYSFAIPLPEHREETPKISIEHYYTDDEIKTEDSEGRRLYMGNEFSSKSGNHKDRDRFCVKKSDCGEKSIHILDNDVFMQDDEETNVALSKNKFCDNIIDKVDNFKDFDYKNFNLIIEMIDEILLIPHSEKSV